MTEILQGFLKVRQRAAMCFLRSNATDYQKKEMRNCLKITDDNSVLTELLFILLYYLFQVIKVILA